MILSITQKYDSIMFSYKNILVTSDDIDERREIFRLAHRAEISEK